MVVTPAQASLWLSQGDPMQRKVRRDKVSAFARDMLEGRWWQESPQSISINKEGLLIDGQHRLLAIVQANVPVQMAVAFDVDGDYGSPLDGGTPRTPSDIIHVDNQRIAAARALRALQTAQRSAVFSVSEIRETLDENREALTACHQKGAIGFKWGGWLTGGLAYAYALDPEKITLFSEQLKTGEALSSGHAAYAMRNRLLPRQQGLRQWELALLACSATAAVLEGRTVTKLERGATSGYRMLTTRRRVLGIPNTPTKEQVETLSLSVSEK